MIWSMSLVERFRADSERIIWPVVPQYVEGLKRAYPAIEWVDSVSHPVPVDIPAPYESNGIRVVPLRWCSQIMGLPDSACMRAKYEAYGVDWRQWRDKAEWKRTAGNERLLAQLFTSSEPYAVISDVYQTDFRAKANIPDSVTPLRIVKMGPLPGFSLFDWRLVLEQASEIHAVSSASLYIFEMLDLKCPIHLYPRATDPTFEHVRFLFSKPYILH